MFIGTYEQSVDAKGRMRIPSRFRDIINTQYNGKLILTNVENYIISYPLEEWMKYQEELQKVPTSHKETKAFMRSIFARATECELDGQGRILISAQLREHAGIDKDVSIIGIMNKIEIWSSDRFKKFQDDMEASGGLNELPEKLGEIGFL